MAAAHESTQTPKKRRFELNLNEIPQDSGNESHAITNLNEIPQYSGNESHAITNGQVAVITYPSESNMDLAAQEPSRPRRPTIHWKSQEHELFLEGVKQFGKGKWKEISKMVATKSPTQVASHAQKHFNKLKTSEKHNGKSKHPRESGNDKSENIGSAALQSVEPLREIHTAGSSVPQNVEPLREIHPADSSIPQSVGPSRHVHPIGLIRTIDITPEDMEKVKKMVSLLEEALKA